MPFYRNINSFGKCVCDVPSKTLRKDIFATAALCILGLMDDLSLTKFEIQIVYLAKAVARKQILQCWKEMRRIPSSSEFLPLFRYYYSKLCLTSQLTLTRIGKQVATHP